MRPVVALLGWGSIGCLYAVVFNKIPVFFLLVYPSFLLFGSIPVVLLPLSPLVFPFLYVVIGPNHSPVIKELRDAEHMPKFV